MRRSSPPLLCLAAVALMQTLDLRAGGPIVEPPVVYYDFQEGAGTVITNKAAGALVHGTLLGNAATWPAGAPGAFTASRGLYFNGVNAAGGGVRVETGLTPVQAGAQDGHYTVAAWVNFAKASGDAMVLGQFATTFLHLGVRNRTFHFGHHGSDTATLDLFPTGVWHHVTWVFQGGDTTGAQRIYVNGQLNRALGDKVRMRTNDPLLVGTTESTTTGRSFQGVLDDLVIYSNALTRSQVQFLAAGGDPNALPATVLADREFYTGRTGPGGTWNLYEVVGFRHGASATWWQAYQASPILDPVAGSGLTGHLVTIGSAVEQEFVRRRLHIQHPDYQFTAVESAWIGLTDDTTGLVTFSNPEGGNTNSVPNVATRRAAFARFVDGSPVVYSNWTGTQPDDSPVTGPGEDGVELQTGGAWNDARSGIPGSGQETGAPDNLYVIEWDVQSPTPLDTVHAAIRRPDPVVTIPIPGPVGGADSWAGRWIRCPASPGDLYGSMRQLLLSQQAGYAGTTLLQTNNIPFINHADPESNNLNQGFIGGDLPFFGNNPAVTNDANFVAIYQGILRVRPSHAGLWTFSTRSDDGFLLKIGDLKWTKFYGAGIVDHGDDKVLMFAAGTGNSDTRGVIDLPVGDHPITYLTFQGAGGTYHELFAAKGDFATEGATDTWQLVGHAAAAESMARLGILDPGDGKGWAVWHSAPGLHGTLSNTGLAYNAVFPNYVVPDTNRTHWATINFYDEGSGQTAAAGSIPNSVRFPWDVAVSPNTPDNQVAMYLRATLVAPANATYYLGFQGDDGSWLRVANKNWNTPIVYSAIAAPNSYIEGDRLVVNVGTGNSRTIGSITLEAGEYDLDMIWWQGGGGAHLEILQGSFGAVQTVAGLGANGSTGLLATGGAAVVPRPVLPLVGAAPPVITITPVSYQLAGGNVSLSFNSERLATYAVESSTNYSAWTPVPGQSGLVGTGAAMTRVFPDNFGQPFVVFRVVRTAP